MNVLCFEKALSYDDPGRHDLKQQAMRINDSPHRLHTCSGASGSFETGPRARRCFPRGVSFRRNTHALARGLAVLNAGHMPP
jgi:hypothetical protein